MKETWIITDECYWYKHTAKQRSNHWILLKNKKTGKKKQLRAGSEIIILKEVR